MKKFVLICGVVIGAGLILLVAGPRLTIDGTWVAVSIAAVCVTALLWKILDHRFAPRREFVIESSTSFKDPAIPFIMRHSFTAVVSVRERLKGEWSYVQKREVVLKIRPENNDAFRRECLRLVGEAIEEQRQLILQMDPKARITLQRPSEMTLDLRRH